MENAAGQDEADRRRDLERLAYGRPTTEREAWEAERALRALLGPNSRREPQAAIEADRGAAPAESSPTPTSHVPTTRSRRWPAVGMAVVVIVIGALCFGIGRSTGGATADRATPPKTVAITPHRTTSSNPDDDRVIISEFTVRSWFASAQRSEDRLPAMLLKYRSSLNLSTSRLAEVDRDMQKLWVVKEKSPESGLCLVDDDESSNALLDDLACATAAELARDGLTMDWTGGTVDWNASGLTIEPSL